MKVIKTIGNCCLIFLTVIAMMVTIAYGYYHFFVHDITMGTNYIDNQIGLDIVNSEDLTEEEKDEFEDRYFLEANFYSNAKNNGVAKPLTKGGQTVKIILIKMPNCLP